MCPYDAKLLLLNLRFFERYHRPNVGRYQCVGLPVQVAVVVSWALLRCIRFRDALHEALGLWVLCVVQNVPKLSRLHVSSRFFEYGDPYFSPPCVQGHWPRFVWRCAT